MTKVYSVKALCAYQRYGPLASLLIGGWWCLSRQPGRLARALEALEKKVVCMSFLEGMSLFK